VSPAPTPTSTATKDLASLVISNKVYRFTVARQVSLGRLKLIATAIRTKNANTAMTVAVPGW
jgi:hypothetical protein